MNYHQHIPMKCLCSQPDVCLLQIFSSVWARLKQLKGGFDVWKEGRKIHSSLTASKADRME